MTSLAMACLHAGGVPVLVEPARHTPPLTGRAQGRNPGGFYEHSGALCQPIETIGPLIGERVAVKLFWQHLRLILEAGTEPDHIIAMCRPENESAASWAAWRTYPLDIESSLVHERAARALMHDVSVLDLDVHQLVDQPGMTCARIVQHCGLDCGLNETATLALVAAMAAVVDPALRHHGVPA